MQLPMQLHKDWTQIMRGQPDPGPLQPLLDELVTLLDQGQPLHLVIVRAQHLDAAFDNQMFEGTIDGLTSGSARLLGKGLVPETKQPLRTKVGSRYIKMGFDRKHGLPGGIEVIDPRNGEKVWRSTGIFPLFFNPQSGTYAGELLTGNATHPKIGVSGTRIAGIAPSAADPLAGVTSDSIQLRLRLVTDGTVVVDQDAKLAAQAEARAKAEAAAPKMQVVTSNPPQENRYDW